MPHGAFIFPTKGECVYCGNAQAELTDEHIVPLSLGGKQVIAKASCTKCADITKRFEQDVARGLWGDARISYNAPSRRKKLRPTHVEFLDKKNVGKKLRFPYDEYPAPMVFYKMFRAGILEGKPPTVDLSVLWEFSVLTDDAKAKKFEEKYREPLRAKFRHVLVSFARLIAKIGYCHTLTLLDIGDFRPFCLPYILGEKTNSSYLVGGSFETAEPIPNIGYKLSTVGFGDENRLVLAAEVRLFANNHVPCYHVVVGDVIGKENIETVLKKIGEITYYGFSAGHFIGDKPTEMDHWMSKIWPLPFDI